MANALPISLEVVACFLLSTALLHRYSDMVNINMVTVVGVFVSWFFSFMVIFLLPADLTSTAYRQCLFDYQASINSSATTMSPSNNSIIFIAPEHNSTNNLALYPKTIPQNSVFANLSSLPNTIIITPPTSMMNSISHLVNNDTSNNTNPCVTPWNYVSDNALTKLWRFIYWTSQLLTWLLLPIMQSYSMAGDFTTLDKLKAAVRANLIYYSSFGAIFTVLLIYVIFKNGIDFANLKVIAISTSNTWGLFLLVVLLGYGLVELPRTLVNRTMYSQSMNQQYFKVSRVNAEKCEAEERLDDVLEGIHQAFTAIGNNEHHPLRRYLDQIVNKCPPDWKRRSNAFRRQAAASNSTYEIDLSKVPDHDVQSMIRLHKKVIKAVHHHRQINCRWNYLIKEVIEWEDVARNQKDDLGTLTTRAFKSTLPKERSFIHSVYTPRVEWFWKCRIRVWLLRIIGIILAVFSLAVVWSEIAFPISVFATKLSIFAYFVDIFQTAQEYFYLELFSTISIGYLAVCAFYTVFHMKIYNVYYLAPNNQTDEYSLLFSGMLMCRLTAPICLNYLCLVAHESHIIKKKSNLETSFTTIMGHLDLIPIVNNGLNVFLPLCISAICSAIYFNVGTHLLHSLGFEQFIENDEMTIDWVQNGQMSVQYQREPSKVGQTQDFSIVMGAQMRLQSTGQEADSLKEKSCHSSKAPIATAKDLNSTIDLNGNLIGVSSHTICIEKRQDINAKSIEDYHSYLFELQRQGRKSRSDRAQPSLSTKPAWFNKELFYNAASVFKRHFMAINFAHLSGLLLLIRVNSIYRTLSKTGESDTVAKLFRRYYHTIQSVKGWYEGDIFDEKSKAHRFFLMTRGMHNKASSKLNDCPSKANESYCNNRPPESDGCSKETTELMKNRVGSNQFNDDYDELGYHISEYDLMITQFAFIGFIVTNADKMGLIDGFSREDLDSLLHFWRVVGFYLGLSDKFNLCSYELKDVVGLCEMLMEIEYKQSLAKNRLESPPGIMSVNILRTIKFIPMITFYGMMRHLCEVIQHETDEIEPRRTKYSYLSYYLINIVMTRLLAYRVLRAFNNGILRLSLFLIGKLEGWFVRRLDSKFGHRLRS